MAGGGYTGGWSSASNSVGQYAQADMGVVRRLNAVATRGRSDAHQWVQTYRFGYSVDGSTYTFITNDDGSDYVFTGNNDYNTIVTNDFESPVVARYVRIYPLTWYSHMSMRMEVYGCDLGTYNCIYIVYIIYGKKHACL